MITLRHARMSMNYLTGTSAKDIAKAEGLSVQRVYQILNKAAYSVMGFHDIALVKAVYVGDFQKRLHSIMNPARQHSEDTPEGFYYELLREPKTRNF